MEMLQGPAQKRPVILVQTLEIESMVKAHVALVVLALASLGFAPNA